MTQNIDTSCCFTGHRTIDSAKLSSLIEKLTLEVGYLAEHGVSDFYAGGALGFDTLAALTVLKLKQRGYDIKLHLILPCPEQTRSWSARDVEVFNNILMRADSSEMMSDHYHGGVMHMRNRAMVDNSGICVCYWDGDKVRPSESGGGTLYTVNYARKLGRTVINLCDEPPLDIQYEFDFSKL